MKKHFQSRKWKRHSKARQRASLSGKQKVPFHVRHIPSPSQSFVSEEIFQPRRRYTKGDVTLSVPQRFSIIENPEEVLQYLDLVSSQLEKGRTVGIDMADVSELGSDAIAFLISTMTNSKYNHGTKVFVNNPHKKALQDLLTNSGFYNYVVSRTPHPPADHGLILSRNKKKVDVEVAKMVRKFAVEHTFGANIRHYALYRVLIECMANTHNHAAPATRGKETWWVFAYSDPVTHRTSITFVDTGVGIFESIEEKTVGNWIKKTFGLIDNREKLQKILNGEVGSRTGAPNRGLGLPSIYNCFINGSIRRLIIISNDTFADLEANSFRRLPDSFSGTLLYWEIHP